MIVSDNGTEFTSNAVHLAGGTADRMALSRTRQPMQNGFVESFNGRLRDECLNEHLFGNFTEARQINEEWRIDYNTNRPNTSLNRLTPIEFATRPQRGITRTDSTYKGGQTGSRSSHVLFSDVRLGIIGYVLGEDETAARGLRARRQRNRNQRFWNWRCTQHAAALFGPSQRTADKHILSLFGPQDRSTDETLST